MKKIVTLSAILAIIGLIASQPALAGRMGSRQANRDWRICRGIADGRLNRGEIRQLARHQHRINRYRQLALADNILTPRERVALYRMRVRDDRQIFRLKHNNRYGICWRTGTRS